MMVDPRTVMSVLSAAWLAGVTLGLVACSIAFAEPQKCQPGSRLLCKPAYPAPKIRLKCWEVADGGQIQRCQRPRANSP